MIVGGVDLDRFDGEGFFCVLGEHGDEYVVHDFGFGFVRGCDVDEDVAGFGTNFRVVAVYDWRHGTDRSVRIEDDGVDGRISNNVKVAGEVLVILILRQY